MGEGVSWETAVNAANDRKADRLIILVFMGHLIRHFEGRLFALVYNG
jgi:hypothetical protein